MTARTGGGAALARLLRQTAERLAEAGIEGAREEAGRLWEAFSGTPLGQILAGGAPDPAPEDGLRFRSWVERRASGEPLAYIEGRVEFHGLLLRVDRRVLIPRPDSEAVVDAALEVLPRGRPSWILDLGTGSGCLLLAILSERPLAAGVGVDRSDGALEVARVNTRALRLEGRSFFVRGSWLDAVAPERADLLVANPPYVEPSDPLGPGVAEFEPGEALFTPAGDPFFAYRAILARAPDVLRPGASLVLEAAAERAAGVAALCSAAGLKVLATRRDMRGIERVVVARRG